MTTYDADHIVHHYYKLGWPRSDVSILIDQLSEIGLDLPQQGLIENQRYSADEFAAIGDQLRSAGTVARIYQSATDWNYATIEIGARLWEYSCDQIELNSTAHTFTTIDGVTELDTFDADQWRDDIAAALASAGWVVVGDLEATGDYAQTVHINRAEAVAS